PCIMIHSDVAKKIKYSNKYKYAEDYHLWFKILKLYKTSNIPEYLTYYRIHENNLSKKYSKIQRESVADLLQDQLEKICIVPSIDELKIHLAILQGLGKQYFNSIERVLLLQEWINKILNYQNKDQDYSINFEESMKK